MARAFKHKRGRYVARLDPLERNLLVTLLRDTLAIVTPPAPPAPIDAFEQIVAELGDLGGGAPLPDFSEEDPALLRLVPDGHHDDPVVSAEFRRLTGRSVRDAKADRLRVAIAALSAGDTAGTQRPVSDSDAEPAGAGMSETETSKTEVAPDDAVVLELEEAQCLATALTDVRLVLADRLQIATDEDAEAMHRLADSDDDPRAPLAVYYDFLSWLQESLVMALMKGAR